MENCIFEAHQGVAAEYPGNTLSAFRAAVRQGYGMIELDTKFTRDGRCVILHDFTLNRTARLPDGSPLPNELKAADLTFGEIRGYDFGLAFDARFRGEPIPTLEDVLSLALETGVSLKFDNVMQSHSEAERQYVYDAVERAGALPLVGFTANSPEYIREILTRFPTARIHYDGVVSPENIDALSRIVPRSQLTVWMRMDNPATSWNTTPPVTPERSEWVRQYADLGVWLLRTEEELDFAVNICHASVIETDGTLKPSL